MYALLVAYYLCGFGNIPNATDVVGRLGWLDHLPTDYICMHIGYKQHFPHIKNHLNMKIVGILRDKVIIEPQYGGDCETYIQLTEKGMKELRSVFNVKEYNSMEDFHADYYYGISEEEYLDDIRKSNERARQIETPPSKPMGNIEAKFMEEHINQMYEDQDDLPF